MKKIASLLLTLILALSSATALAQDGLILTATVQAAQTVALKAPASGELAHFTVRAGDVARAGEALFTVQPVHVYADMDGTVAAVYGEEGDIADALVSRYGAVMHIDHALRYEVRASTLTGKKNAENRDLHVGTPVYLRSINEEHFANGVIIAVNGTEFTVQVLDGDLVFTEDVRIYRDPEYTSASLLGRAGLSALAPVAVSASGTIVDMAVKAGDRVQKGDHLFSYVPDVLDPALRGKADATAVKPGSDLLVTAVNVQAGASVQKGQALITAVPLGCYELVAQAEEGDVQSLNVGDVMQVTFEEIDMPALQATVSFISPLGQTADVSTYEVRLAFTAPDGVWIGMHATLER